MNRVITTTELDVDRCESKELSNLAPVTLQLGVVPQSIKMAIFSVRKITGR